MSTKLIFGYCFLCGVCCFTSIADDQFNTCKRESADASVVEDVQRKNVQEEDALQKRVYSGRESENAKTYIYLLRSSRGSCCSFDCARAAGLRLGAIRVESEGEFGRFRIPKENEECGIIWSAFVFFGEEEVKFSYHFGENYSDSFIRDENREMLLEDREDFFHSEKGKEILCKQMRVSGTNELSIESILRMALFRWRVDNVKTLTEFFEKVSEVGRGNCVRINGMKVRPKYDLYGIDGYNCATFSREALFYLLEQDSQKSARWRSVEVAAVAGGVAGFVASTYLLPYLLPVVTAAIAGYSIPATIAGYSVPAAIAGYSIPAACVNRFALLSRIGFVTSGWTAGASLGTGVDNCPESVANEILSSMKERYKSAEEEKRKLEDSFKIIFHTVDDIHYYTEQEMAKREGISYAQRTRTLADNLSDLKTKQIKDKKGEKTYEVTVFLDTDFKPNDDAIDLM